MEFYKFYLFHPDMQKAFEHCRILQNQYAIYRWSTAWSLDQAQIDLRLQILINVLWNHLPRTGKAKNTVITPLFWVIIMDTLKSVEIHSCPHDITLQTCVLINVRFPFLVFF